MSNKKEIKSKVVDADMPKVIPTPSLELEESKQIIGKALAQYRGTIQEHQVIQKAFNTIVKACGQK